MKKIITLLLLTGSISLAQASEKTPVQVKQAAGEFARQLINTLQLNEHEYLKVKELTEEKLTVLHGISENYANDQEMLKRKITEAELAYQKQLAHILSTRQLDSYLSLYGNTQE